MARLFAREDSPKYYAFNEPQFITEHLTRAFKPSTKVFLELGKPKSISENTINFTQPDYLALSHHPTIIDAGIRALMDTSIEAQSSRQFSPKTFENRVATLCRYEDAMLIPSGWNAIINVLQTLTGMAVPVYLDDSISDALQESIRRIGLTSYIFKRLAPLSLDHALQTHGAGIVIVNAISDIDGSIAPLTELALLVKQHGSLIIVDESHSLGLFSQGTGLVTELNLEKDIHIITANFTTVFCDKSGIIIGRQRYLDYMRRDMKEMSSGFIFLPHDVAKVSSTLDIIQKDEWRRVKLRSNATYLRNRLRHVGYAVNMSQSHIVTIYFHNKAEIHDMYHALKEQDIVTTCCVHTLGEERQQFIMRFIVNAKHNKQELDKTIDVMESIKGATSDK